MENGNGKADIYTEARNMLKSFQIRDEMCLLEMYLYGLRQAGSKKVRKF